MKQNTSQSVIGHHFTRFFQFALAMLMLSALSGAALAEEVSDTAMAEEIAKVNLNTADAETLQYIPGVGPGKAAEILRVRVETGGFKVIEDLLTVPGVGEKILIDIKKHGSIDSGVSTLTTEMAENPPMKTVSVIKKSADEELVSN